MKMSKRTFKKPGKNGKSPKNKYRGVSNYGSMQG